MADTYDSHEATRRGKRSFLRSIVNKVKTAITNDDIPDIEVLRGWLSSSERELLIIRDLDQKMGELINDSYDPASMNLNTTEGQEEKEKFNTIIDKFWQDSGDFTLDIVTTQSVIQRLIEKKTPNSLKNSCPQTQQNTSFSKHSVLKKIEVPSFDGNLLKFGEFWSRFDHHVNKIPDHVMSKGDKLAHLRNSLKGEAEGIVENIDGDDYDFAINELKRRYGRRIPRISAHMGEIDKLTIPPTKDIKGLRRAVDTLISNVRALVHLNVVGRPKEDPSINEYSRVSLNSSSQDISNPGDTSVLLCCIVFFKLPTDLRLQWSRSHSDDDMDIHKLLDFLRIEVEGRENFCDTLSSENSSNTNRIGHDHRSKHQVQSRTTGAFTTSGGSSTHSNSPCCFCEQNHPPWVCDKINSISPQERFRLIQEANRCVRCLSSKHSTKQHYGEKPCKNCKRTNHHYLLCFATDSDPTASSEQSSAEKSKNSTSVVGIVRTRLENKSRQIYLQTAVAHVDVPHGIHSIRIVADGGSELSYITKKAAQQLKLKPENVIQLDIEGFGGKKSGNSSRIVHRLKIQNRYNGETVEIEALEVDTICHKIFNRISRDTANMLHIRDLQLGEMFEDDLFPGPREISLLIGGNHYYDVVYGDIRRGDPGQPVAVASLLGWLIAGPSPHYHKSDASSNFFTTSFLAVESVDNLLQDFFDAESLGELPNDDVDPVLHQFEKSIQFNGERYQVSLPWKENHPPLQNNYRQALVRLQQLEKRLNRNVTLKHGYSKAIQEMIDLNFVEEVKEDAPSHAVFYLPHHPVVKMSRCTTKIRPVFNASAVGPNRVSLNDCLYKGPSLISQIHNILFRFRTHPVALTSDIAKAYLQLELLQESDRDVHRFLWFKNGEIIKYRFNRVTFGIISSAFLLNATIQHHLRLIAGDHDLQDDIYVDDLVTGEVGDKEAILRAKFCSTTFQNAGMELRKWSSNCSEVLRNLKSNGKDINPEAYLHLLGIGWNTSSDTLNVFSVPLSDSEIITKRIVVSHVAKLFDPLGLTGPISVRGKIFIQNLWKLGIDWDQELPDKYLAEFRIIEQSFSTVDQLEVPRHVLLTNEECLEIHLFTDASIAGFASVVYFKTNSGVHLVVSKSSVAPLKTHSLPRLELLACHLGSLLLSKLIYAVPKLKRVPITCWSDSAIALCWIHSSSKIWKQFISNRVKIIQSIVQASSWRHCPGKDNPADLATRNNSTIDDILSPFWQHGPSWLSKVSSEWPSQISFLDSNVEFEISKEKKATQVLIQSCQIHQTEAIFDLSRHSNLERALRITAYVLRAASKFKLLKKTSENNKNSLLPFSVGDQLSLDEVKHAELYWIKHTQISIPQSQWEEWWKLGPTLDNDGIYRSVGRTSRVDFNFPVILPSNSPFTLLAIKRAHETSLHSGAHQTLSVLRQRFWVVRGRQVVRSLINDCRICRKFRSKTYLQVESALPSFRIERSRPFETTGVDFAGPFEIKSGKAWVALFTCATTRYVYLDLVPSLSANDFLLTFRKFKADFGPIENIFSDNGKTFVSARKLLVGQVNWKFIPEYGPWWGGMWESLVKSMKSSLKKVLGRSLLDFATLLTILKEIQARLNQRPLMPTNDDPDDPQPLRPADFLQTPCINSERPDLLSARQYRIHLLELTWKRWRHDYLSHIRSWHRKQFGSGIPKVGDVVILEPGNGFLTNRALFPLGRIVEVITGRDGVIRAACVRSRGKIVRRPTRLLYPLEVQSSIPTSASSLDAKRESETNPHTNIPQSTRIHKSSDSVSAREYVVE